MPVCSRRSCPHCGDALELLCTQPLATSHVQLYRCMHHHTQRVAERITKTLTLKATWMKLCHDVHNVNGLSASVVDWLAKQGLLGRAYAHDHNQTPIYTHRWLTCYLESESLAFTEPYTCRNLQARGYKRMQGLGYHHVHRALWSLMLMLHVMYNVNIMNDCKFELGYHHSVDTKHWSIKAYNSADRHGEVQHATLPDKVCHPATQRCG